MLNAFPSPSELKGAVLGTVAYLALYATFLFFQSFTKIYLIAKKKNEAKQKGGSGKISFKDVKYYNKEDSLAILGDRTVGNFSEWALMFLPLLWIHALFVDPSQSLWICMIYTGSRAFYPIFFIQRQKLMVLFSTVPGYMVLFYLLYQIVYHANFE